MCRPRRPVPPLTPLLTILALGLLAEPSAAELPYHRLAPEPQVLALTPGLEGAELAALLDRLEAEGIRVPVAVAGAGLVIVDRPGLEDQLAAAGVGRVLREAPADPEAAPRAGASLGTAALLRWWADGFTVPALSPEERRELEEAARSVTICAGARTAEEVLAERGVAVPRSSPYGRVHFAAGRTVCHLVLPESDGAGSLYDWASGDITKVGAELVRALDWWALKAGGKLGFVLVNHGTVPTQHEPALLSITQEGLYITDCLASLGFPGAAPFQQVTDMNEAGRAEYRAHWAFTQFVLNAESFPGSSALAYAYLGGPHTVALRGNGVLSLEELDRVIAHEVGHIFQTADEYAGCSCGGGPYGYLDAINGNCVHCPVQEGKCVMRGSGEYSLAEMHDLERSVHPCSYTRKMAGMFDGDGDGIWDVMDTYPETEMTSSIPDTLDDPQNFRAFGRTWDTPYPAPARFGEPVTVNHIRRVEVLIDGGFPVQARAVDGIFGDVQEEFEIVLPPLGGGTHFALVRGVNSVEIEDPTPVRRDFFVYDVKLRRDIEVLQEGSDFAVTWVVEGEDLGSTYRLYRRRGAEAPDALVATIPSKGGRHDRFTHWDRQVPAGYEYIYRLEADIPGKGPKTLGIARQSAVLAPPAPGAFVSIAPNPARGEVQFSITVPIGPRPGQPDVILPGDFASPGLRDDNPWSGGSGGDDLLWRDVRLSVYDIRGRVVRDLGVFRHQETTRFNAGWNGSYRDGSAAPAGVYFLRIRLDYIETIEKLVLVR